MVLQIRFCFNVHSQHYISCYLNEASLKVEKNFQLPFQINWPWKIKLHICFQMCKCISMSDTENFREIAHVTFFRHFPKQIRKWRDIPIFILQMWSACLQPLFRLPRYQLFRMRGYHIGCFSIAWGEGQAFDSCPCLSR